MGPVAVAASSSGAGHGIALLVVASQWRMPLVAVLLAALALGGSRLRAAVAFRELRELAGVRTEARTDELTELGNRRSFVESLDTALASASDERPVAVVLIDLDDFKEVNDTLGHHFGDELLMGVGRILRENVRSQDVVARLGGAATLDLQLVAEGVETETARTALAQLGVRFAQGWLFSRAQPAPELERWATEQRPASSAR